MIKAIKSFESTGDVETRLNVFHQDLASNPSAGTPDVRLKFLFEPGFSYGFLKQGDTASIVNNKNVTNKSMVIYASVSSVKTETQVRNDSKAKFEEEFKANKATLKSTKTSTVTYNNIKWTIDTHDFGNFEAQTITAVYPNGMIVCIRAKYVISSRSKVNSYIKDLERSIRLENA